MAPRHPAAAHAGRGDRGLHDLERSRPAQSAILDGEVARFDEQLVSRASHLWHPRGLPQHRKNMMTKRILVPVRRSESHATMAVVRGLARDQGSTVRLLRVLPVPELVVGLYGRPIAYVDQDMERLTAQGVDELVFPAAEVEGVPVVRVARVCARSYQLLCESASVAAALLP